MKKILGLDLGTNSIGWAVIQLNTENKQGKILGLNSRIIPMSQDVLGKFDNGVSTSQTAERTEYRGTRRLRQRHLLRRERLHRVLNILNFLPNHYAEQIDFGKHFGKFKENIEVKLAWKEIENKKFEFIFQNSFDEMLNDFKANGFTDSKIPYDWTIYYLRKKALTHKIEKEELAWLLLHFNQKRGYYQLRGEEEEENKNKLEEFYTLLVTDVIEREKGKSGTWYNIVLENGWIYKRESKIPLHSWIGKEKEFIVTTELNDDGSIKLNKDNEEKRSFRAPKEDDWGLIKIRTEKNIHQSGKTVGAFIYDALLENPSQKINGQLVRTIERKFYKEELQKILETQVQFHPELQNNDLYEQCLNDLYKQNEAHKNNIRNRNFTYLFINDIIFYQRPLKSKKSLISNCPFEYKTYQNKGELQKEYLKCIAKSNPLFQEFRLWQWIANLKIFKIEDKEDIDVTNNFLKSEEDYVKLFDLLNNKKDVTQKQFLAIYKLKEQTHRWNYVIDKTYPCNETRALFLSKVEKIQNFNLSFFNEQNTQALWHILYSVTDKIELESAISKFTKKHNLPNEFEVAFKKLPPYKSEYGAYSEKAIKKLLPLLRKGKYWNKESIHPQTVNRIDKIIDGEYDENIKNRVREKTIDLNKIEDFKGLPLWLASYVVYDRHSEAKDLEKWKTPEDITYFLKTEFKQHSLRNPIVEQVITETLRTVRDIWKKYGDFNKIHIELGREMKNPADKRKKMTEQISANENTNLRIKALLEELKNDNSQIRPYSPSQQEILKIFEEGVYSNENRKEELETIDKIRKNNKVTKAEIQRYKLWLEQGYISPYTGAVINLSDLFSNRYEIEHIFPQSRFFDDSLSNKVICESEVNKLKDNQTAMEFIKNHHGKEVTLDNGNTVKVLEVVAYETHVKQYFAKNKTKQRNLLQEDIPESFINRQLNDSRYISKVIKMYLSKIVRQEQNGELEQEATSKNVVSLTGSITSTMKQDWGLNDVWNDLITPRFERLNQLTNSNDFGQWENKQGKQVFQTAVPDVMAKGFSKKRIDHRHHALDALVIACVTSDHINYLNSINSERKNYSLVSKLRRMEEEIIKGEKRKIAKEFHKPWDTFTQEAKENLSKAIISFKQNTRIINKTINKYEKYKDGKKELVVQNKGDNWAIRKPLHAETVSGKVFLKREKETLVSINSVLENPNKIVDAQIKKELKKRSEHYKNNIEGLKKYLKTNPIKIDGKAIDKIKIYETIEATATRKTLDSSFDEKRIAKITDTGIQKILMNHLKQDIYQNVVDENGKKLPPSEVAFSTQGLEALHKNMLALNNGKPHQPIKKVRVFEEGGKFALSEKGNKKNKYVEAAKGTNLFFAVYQDENGNRSYKTIPLNEAIESQKKGLDVAPLKDEKNNNLLFTLSPNDLVYIPTEDERENPTTIDFNNLSKEQIGRLYNVNDFSTACYFYPNSVAKAISPKEVDMSYDVEKSKITGSYDTKTASFKGEQIKDICWKLQTDRLGNIIKSIKK